VHFVGLEACISYW